MGSSSVVVVVVGSSGPTKNGCHVVISQTKLQTPQHVLMSGVQYNVSNGKLV